MAFLSLLCVAVRPASALAEAGVRNLAPLVSAGPSKLAMHCCPSLAFALPDTWSAVTPTLSAGLESSMSRVVELPLHMFTVALEEHLLLSAFRHLLGVPGLCSLPACFDDGYSQ